MEKILHLNFRHINYLQFILWQSQILAAIQSINWWLTDKSEIFEWKNLSNKLNI